ncbi:DUF732 domain-containing protein [Mycolicibacter longobardus]|uniref:DUF732 domain-containing protein n=1 Tax=Mycolicibacter longobardus TaxID=1108812 RepID=UPI000A164ECA|nr:DUF732 domain-containing protein [Mycolicibacter longobardus]
MTLSTSGTAKHRIAKKLSAGVAAAGLLLGTAGVATADDQSYLDYLFAHGFTYHPGVQSPEAAINIGHGTCDNLHRTGDARHGLSPISNAIIPNVMIEGAQHELCPDTLESAPEPVGEPS